ncbi:MAG: heparinase II/III family protein, partial [Ktedonobacteraceae bacterium]|nr:heparinase II/III family protein [Ktedonobacteraceae bacterium]
ALQLTGSNCASFADCDEEVFLSHGLLSRLALRTGQRAQLQLMPRQLQPLNRTSLASLLCDLLWWDGRWLETSAPQDSLLPLGNIGRLVAQTQDGAPVVLAFKAGHNNEHHNHNDIGSFILHSAGENLLADPGRGLYSRANFDSRRYQNIFNNSYGHSVPRLAGQLQPPGEQYYGTLSEIERDDTSKAIEIDFTHAYALPQLQEARRHLQLITEGKENGTLLLRDNFIFTQPTEVEEAFSTWFDTRIEGSTATILGQWQGLSMTIEEPAVATFQVEQLEQESRENQKSGVLKRITVTLPPDREQQVRIRMRPFTRQEA